MSKFRCSSYMAISHTFKMVNKTVKPGEGSQISFW